MMEEENEEDEWACMDEMTYTHDLGGSGLG